MYKASPTCNSSVLIFSGMAWKIYIDKDTVYTMAKTREADWQDVGVIARKLYSWQILVIECAYPSGSRNVRVTGAVNSVVSPEVERELGGLDLMFLNC